MRDGKANGGIQRREKSSYPMNAMFFVVSWCLEADYCYTARNRFVVANGEGYWTAT